MVTFLAGGTGTPKLLPGARARLDPAAVTVVANTGDDVELGGLLVCPDVDTVLFEGGDVLDRETWWGLADDAGTTHEYLGELAADAGIDAETPRYLPDERQTAGRELGRWRRFSAAAEFMYIGDRDRAVHLLRTSLLDEGNSLTDVTRRLADAFGLAADVVPMSDDPVASIVHTPEGPLHFQAFWVARGGEPAVDSVEFRGATDAAPAAPALAAVREGPVVIGPSNPITSIGPMLAIDELRAALTETTVVAVSPFVEDEAFSGPAPKLMRAAGYDASTAGVADAYPFADAFVLDSADGTDLDVPVVRTDTRLDGAADAERVMDAVERALDRVGASLDAARDATHAGSHDDTNSTPEVDTG